MSAERKQLRCPKCQSADLVLHEAHLEHGEYGDGLFINEGGEIEAVGVAYFSPGEPVSRLTRIECEGCGRRWHPRRQFIGITLQEKA